MLKDGCLQVRLAPATGEGTVLGLSMALDGTEKAAPRPGSELTGAAARKLSG
jgi:hypothetical protein